jgi:hypothetical protein
MLATPQMAERYVVDPKIAALKSQTLISFIL